MAKRRLPRGVREEYVDTSRTHRSVKEIMHRWVSKERRRTHKRERQEGRRAAERGE